MARLRLIPDGQGWARSVERGRPGGGADGRPRVGERGFAGYFLIEGSSGVLSSLGLFDTPEHADKSTMVVSKWITDEHFDKAIPNAPKITSGKVVAQSDRVLTVA